MGDAVGLVLFMVRVGMPGMLVVGASVQLADFLDEAYHGLMMVVWHHRGEQDHHHRDKGWEYGEFSEHFRKLTQNIAQLKIVCVFIYLQRIYKNFIDGIIH